MATARQQKVLALHKRRCQFFQTGNTGSAHYGDAAIPSTLKHRAETGATTSVGLNLHYEQADPFVALPATTDFLVWAVWEFEKLRSTSSDGGDTAAGGQWGRRAKAQMPSLDINGVEITVSDEDWILAADGVTLFEIENPILDPTGSVWNFSMVAQQ